jgi:tetraacyldisaccharide 4'-kinase
MREPDFWWRGDGAAARLLAPAGALYGFITARRMAQGGRRAAVPVLCIGNFTVGGSGKTPTAIAAAQILINAGRRPFFLSRGYGGRLAGPVRVDRQTADEIGDEPLLLSRLAPAIVARDRPAGAEMAADAGADVIVMDDGWQNPSLEKDLAIAVLDGRRGIGNGRVFPAGPLRAPLESQLDHADAMLVIGHPAAGAAPAIAAAARRGLARFDGELVPDPAALAKLAGVRALAFAGIADPGKFFATLEASGITVAARRSFPDHHRFAPNEIADLLAHADHERLMLVTTEKDLARLAGDPAARELVARSATLPVTLKVGDELGFKRLLLGAISARRAVTAAATPLWPDATGAAPPPGRHTPPGAPRSST